MRSPAFLSQPFHRRRDHSRIPQIPPSFTISSQIWVMQRCCNAGTEYAGACRNNLNRTLVGSCSDMRARRQADGFGSLRASPSGHVVRGRGAIPRLDRRARDSWPSGRRHLLRNQKAREGPQVRILHYPQMAPAYVRCYSVSGPMREACWYRRHISHMFP